MKVIYIQSGSPWNGPRQQIHEVTEVLASAGFDVKFSDSMKFEVKSNREELEDKGHNITKNIELLPSPAYNAELTIRNIIFYFFKQNNFLKQKLKKRIDSVNYYVTNYPFYSPSAFLYAKKNKKKMVYFILDDYTGLATNWLLKKYIQLTERLFIKKSDLVICTAKLLYDRNKKYNKNTFYLPNGIRLKEISNIKGQPKTDERLQICFVGLLGNWVNTDDIVFIAESFPEVNIDVVGDGPKLENLKDKIAAKSLKNIKIHGFLPRKNALEILSNSNIALIPFVKSYLTDCVSPIKLFEDWALGKCVVATRTYELSQYEKEIALYSNHEELRSIIHELKNNNSRLKHYEVAGKNKVTKHDWEGSLGKRLLMHFELIK